MAANVQLGEPRVPSWTLSALVAADVQLADGGAGELDVIR
jgi:hypothetical protein